MPINLIPQSERDNHNGRKKKISLDIKEARDREGGERKIIYIEENFS